VRFDGNFIVSWDDGDENDTNTIKGVMQLRRCALSMGWLRLVGSSKLHVSFAEYRLFYRALLQKRSIIFKEPTNQSHPIVVLL